MLQIDLERFDRWWTRSGKICNFFCLLQQSISSHENGNMMAQARISIFKQDSSHSQEFGHIISNGCFSFFHLSQVSVSTRLLWPNCKIVNLYAYSERLKKPSKNQENRFLDKKPVLTLSLAVCCFLEKTMKRRLEFFI